MLGFRTSFIMTMHTGSLWSNGFHVAADSIVAVGYLGQDKAVKIVMVIKAAASILIVFGRKLLSIARIPGQNCNGHQGSSLPRTLSAALYKSATAWKPFDQREPVCIVMMREVREPSKLLRLASLLFNLMLRPRH